MSPTFFLSLRRLFFLSPFFPPLTLALFLFSFPFTQKPRNASAAPTEGTVLDNTSSSGGKNSDGEVSASRGATAATKTAKAAVATATDAADADETSPLPSSSPAPPRAPASFYCPISMELMADPVIVATGHTYDRRCIERWLSAGHGTCPATGARLRHLELTPNFALRDAVAEWALREGVPVPQPEDGGERTAAALLYKGGGGGEGRAGIGGSELSSSRRRAAAAAASRFAEEATTPAAAAVVATEERDEEEEENEAPRQRQQQQATPKTAEAPNDASSLLRPPTILRGHHEIVWAVESSKGRLFSASADRSVRVWDVASRRCEAVLEDHARPVLCLALAPAADAVEGVASSSSSSSKNPKNPEEEERKDEGESGSDDDLLFSGSYDFTIKAWSLRTLSRVKTLTGHADAVRSLLYVPPTPKKKGEVVSALGGNNLGRRGRLFSASYDGTVRVWDVATLEPVAALPGHSGPVRTLACVDGLVFSGSYDKTVREEKVSFSFEFFFSTSTATDGSFFSPFLRTHTHTHTHTLKNRSGPGTPTRSTRPPASRATPRPSGRWLPSTGRRLEPSALPRRLLLLLLLRKRRRRRAKQQRLPLLPQRGLCSSPAPTTARSAPGALAPSPALPRCAGTRTTSASSPRRREGEKGATAGPCRRCCSPGRGTGRCGLGASGH